MFLKFAAFGCKISLPAGEAQGHIDGLLGGAGAPSVGLMGSGVGYGAGGGVAGYNFGGYHANGTINLTCSEVSLSGELTYPTLGKQTL